MGHGNAGFFSQCPHALGTVRQGDAAADIKKRLFRFIDQIRSFFKLLYIYGRHLRITTTFNLLRNHGIGFSRQYVAGQIDQHRPGPARARNMECLANHAGQILDMGHHIIMFGDRAGNAGHIGFLKSIIADIGGCHLTGQGHHRDRVHKSGGNSSYQIGCTRPRSGQADSDLAGGSGITVSGMGRSLFMPHQNVANFGVEHQGVMHLQGAGTGITENKIDPLSLQTVQ